MTTQAKTAPTAAASSTPTDDAAEPTMQDQAGMLLGHVAGYMAQRVIEMGLRSGLVKAIADSPSITADQLADKLGFDDFYTAVWCRAGYGAGLLERSGSGFALAPHVATLLLDTESPGFVGAMFPLVLQPEMFGRFADNLASGERLWWDETSPAWIDGVSGTGQPFYTRLIPGGLAQVPGLADGLATSGRVVEHACGAGLGLLRLAQAYPQAQIIGVDGDAHSLELARARVEAAGLAARVELVQSSLEEFKTDQPASVVINNISMHECRDIDQATDRVYQALEPGGWFVISDFPFPDTDRGLRSIPGRIMSGIQFFEAQIDDQLLPRTAYDDLLSRHGFVELGWLSLSPVHAVTYGRRADN